VCSVPSGLMPTVSVTWAWTGCLVTSQSSRASFMASIASTAPGVTTPSMCQGVCRAENIEPVPSEKTSSPCMWGLLA